MRQFGFAVALAGVLAASAIGQEAVTIKPSKPKAGDRVRVSKTEKGTNTTTFSVGGKEQAKADEFSKKVVYVDEILTPGTGDEKPVKLTRVYEKYEVSKGGKDDDSPPPLNTAITIEKKGGKYTYTADGKPVEPGVAKRLDEEFSKPETGLRGEDFLPGKPVKPGETWKPDPKKLAKAIGGGDGLIPDAEKIDVTCKLVSTSKKDGKQFGTLDVKATIPIKGLGGKGDVKFKSGAMAMTMTGDLCLDGTDPSEKGTGTMTVDVEAETMGITFKVAVRMKMEEARELLPKK